jgi:arylesterase/paraoxonase
MPKKWILVMVIPVVLAGGWLLHLMWSAGEFTTIEPHFNGTCRQIPGVAGAEDITIHQATGIAYISACDRRAVEEGRSGNGALYAYDLNQPHPQPVLLTNGPEKDFQPHGLSLYVDDSGRISLFVVNHGNGRHAVEIFDFLPDRLQHRRTVTGDLLLSPNDLVAVGPEQFYVTNDHGWHTPLKKTVENYLKLRLSSVLYFDGSTFSEAAGGLGYANGINISPAGNRLYVAATTEKTLYRYDRDPRSNALGARHALFLDSGPDNIEIDDDGTLWVAAHPQLLHFVFHAGNPEKRSPSQVFRIVDEPEGAIRIEEVYLDSGEQLSASAVGTAWRNRLLIGPVFDPCFLDCEMINEKMLR